MADTNDSAPVAEEIKEIQEALGEPILKTRSHSLSLRVNAKREVLGTCLCGAELPDREAILAHAEQYGITVVV